MPDPYLEILAPEGSLLRHFEQTVELGLQRYRTWFHDRGAKKGKSLFDHLTGGAVLIHAVHEFLGLSGEETRVAMAAFAVHDANKCDGAGERSFRDILDDKKFMDGLFGDAHLDEFLAPLDGGLAAWREDVLCLVRLHSGHNAVSGQTLIPAADRTRLGNDCLRHLAAALRMADVIELSSDITETTHKQSFLDYANQVRYWKKLPRLKLLFHRIAEDRGLLSNALHNAARRAVVHAFPGAVAVLAYAQGFLYLLPEDAAIDTERLGIESVNELREGLNERRRDELRRLVKKGDKGITVDPSALGAVPADRIAAEVSARCRVSTVLIPGGGFGPWLLARQGTLKDALRLGKSGPAALVEELTASGLRLPATTEDMQRGELVRAIVNALKSGGPLESEEDPWTVLYRELAVPAGHVASLEPFDKLYVRPYLVAANLPLSHEQLQERFAALLTRAAEVTPDAEDSGENDVPSPSGDQDHLATWVTEILSFATIPAEASAPKRRGFLEYVEAALRQKDRCCFSATRSAVTAQMSGQMPDKLKVQQFSNRLPGGGGEPKRDACGVCREAFRLERLVLPKGGEKSIYLHLVPPGFIAAQRLEEIAAAFRGLAATMSDDPEPEPLGYFAPAELMDEDVRRGLHLRGLRGVGDRGIALGVPRAPEALGPTLVLPLATGIDATGARFLHALALAGRIALTLRLGLVLSESPLAVAHPTHPGGALLDGLPSALAELTGGRELDARGLRRLVDDIGSVMKIERLVRPKPNEPDPRHAVVLCQAVAAAGLGVFAEADRFLERRVEGEPLRAAGAARDLVPHVRQLLREKPRARERLECVEDLVRVARDGRLDGPSDLKRTPVLAPLSLALDHLRRDGPPLDLATSLAAAANDTLAHLERRGHASARAASGTRAFSEAFRRLLERGYGGNVQTLLVDAKALRATFVILFRAHAAANWQGATTGPLVPEAVAT